ncbi:T-complex protein 1 subunit gamma [Homalodisca vitripennis]|nr:T-complex protein 1 subunit gamma [Homalodisca vitripennis]
MHASNILQESGKRRSCPCYKLSSLTLSLPENLPLSVALSLAQLKWSLRWLPSQLAEQCIVAGWVLHCHLVFATPNNLPQILVLLNRALLVAQVEFQQIPWKITPLDVTDKERLTEVVKSCVGTKFIGRWADMACKIALEAVQTVMLEENGRKEIDIKRYARVEKIPGGSIEDSYVLNGVMINKDVTHPKMRRVIKNPRIVLLDCTLEYKKGESQTNVEIMNETDFTRILQLEEEYIEKVCADIIALKPDVVFTEKGVSDLAQHYLVKANISAVRRVRKSDNNRIARACGATIVNRTEELKEDDVGTGAGLFEIKKVGDEYFCFITECKDPKACTIMLRGASKDVLNETERNLQDALHVARNIMLQPRLVPGGGAVEMAVSKALLEKGKSVEGVAQWPYRAVAQALEVIPRTLAQNCGANTIRTLTALRAKHATGGTSWGINGETGAIVDMKELGIWEPLAVKLQIYKTAVETAILLLRIDDIVSGSKKKDRDGEQKTAQPTEESMKE